MDNIYKLSRIKAAATNKRLGSLEKASNELGGSVPTLCRWENGNTPVAPETVVSMSLLYNDPGLRRLHCCLNCAIGRLDNRYEATRDLASLGYVMKASNEKMMIMYDDLSTKLSDGQLTHDEIVMLADNHEVSLMNLKSAIDEILVIFEKERSD